MHLLRLLLPTLLGLGLAAPLAAQQPGAWNAPRALELIERSSARRELPRSDSALTGYRADAGGYVYFYLDRNASSTRTLVRVDQIALEVYWNAPDETKQRIVGLRNQSRLPNKMHYHLDHLTVVQNEFGDSIRLGDGDEVRDVLHPAAPGADAIYDFRVADSLTLHLPGAPEPVRVYEVEVRPRRVDRPAFVGSLFIDRASADIVRMTFTFTPASYVDRRLDYIRLSLDNGLWNGRYWLPHEQRIEIRRQLPELDFVAGAVIKGVIKLRNYEFNEELPPGFFLGPAVTALPERLREAYAFEEGLFAGLEEEDLAPPPHMDELRRQAAELIGSRYLSGLPRVRLHIPNASSVLRYNRAEGVFLGGGLSYRPAPSTRLELGGGYAFDAEQSSVRATARHALGGSRLRLDGYVNQLRDLGVHPAIPGVWNTFSAALFGDDYIDPYFADGLRLSVAREVGAHWAAELGAFRDEVESAELETRTALFDGEAEFRPVRPIRAGTDLGVGLALRRTGSTGGDAFWSAEAAVEAGAFEPADRFSGLMPDDDNYDYLRPTLTLEGTRRAPDRSWDASGRFSAGAALGSPPAHRLFLLGGLGTLPGYPFRAFAGDRFALAEAEASHELASPWLRLRAIGAAGWTSFGSGPDAPTGWGTLPTDGIRASAGVGLGLFWDVLRLDAVRGLNAAGEWQLLLTVRPGLWDIL